MSLSDLDVATVRQMARLARLRIEPERAEAFVAELSRIVEFVGVLDQLPADDGDDDARATPLRDDVVTTSPHPEELLAAAPDRDGTRLRVPAAIREAT